MWQMASNFGRVVERPGRRSTWCIDLGRAARPRYLYTARGAKFESREMAQAVLDAIRVKIAKGVEPQAAVEEFAPVSGEHNACSSWHQRYVVHMSERCAGGDLSPTTLRELHRFARSDFAFWKDKSIHEIDAFHVDGYARWLRNERDLAPKSVRNALGQLRAFCTWLRRLERIDKVPAFPRVRVPEHAPTIISPRTQSLVLHEISWEERGAFLACCLGVRPGEVRALDFRHVQERDGAPGLLISAAVKGSNAQSPIRGTKTGDASWIPISPDLAEWIEWRKEQRTGAFASRALFVNPGAYLGPNPDGRWSANGLRRVWHAAAAKVGVHVALYEGSKHSTASNWYSDGVPLPVVQRMLRHTDTRSTARYAKLSQQGLIEAFKPKRRS
jgi:integrase